MGILQQIDEKDLQKLSLEEKKKVITESVDVILDDVIYLAKIVEEKPSKVLNTTLQGIHKQISLQEQKENYEMCWFLNEIMWEIRSRLDKEKQRKGSGL
jgi:hypothetical protein